MLHNWNNPLFLFDILDATLRKLFCQKALRHNRQGLRKLPLVIWVPCGAPSRGRDLGPLSSVTVSALRMLLTPGKSVASCPPQFNFLKTDNYPPFSYFSGWAAGYPVRPSETHWHVSTSSDYLILPSELLLVDSLTARVSFFVKNCSLLMMWNKINEVIWTVNSISFRWERLYRSVQIIHGVGILSCFGMFMPLILRCTDWWQTQVSLFMLLQVSPNGNRVILRTLRFTPTGARQAVLKRRRKQQKNCRRRKTPKGAANSSNQHWRHLVSAYSLTWLKLRKPGR